MPRPASRVHLPLRTIEQRFQELDARQEQLSQRRLNRSGRGAAARRGGGGGGESAISNPLLPRATSTPPPSSGGDMANDDAAAAAASARESAVVDLSGTSRVGSAAAGAVLQARTRVQAALQHDIDALRSKASRVLAEQRAVDAFMTEGGAHEGTADENLKAEPSLQTANRSIRSPPVAGSVRPPLSSASASKEGVEGVASSPPRVQQTAKTGGPATYAMLAGTGTEYAGATRFVPLFDDDTPEDRVKQARTIDRLIRAAADREKPRPGTAPSRPAPTVLRPPTTAATTDTRADLGTAGSAAPYRNAARRLHSGKPILSPYANPNPPAMRAMYAQRGAAAEAAAQAAAQRAAELDGVGVEPRARTGVAAHLFRQLPPVIPTKSHVKRLAQRVDAAAYRMAQSASASPHAEEGAGLAATDTPAHDAEAASLAPPTAGLTPASRLALKHFNPEDAIFTKEFYYLHVKIVQTKAKLVGWEFSVTITDVTDPRRLLRHTFHHLKVNENMHIVFKPPGQVHLSPADDIPWVPAPEALFMHTLRIEVHSTHPSRSKVVDSMVFFGDVIPSDDIASLHATATTPSASRGAQTPVASSPAIPPHPRSAPPRPAALPFENATAAAPRWENAAT